ncbi:MAG TPA: hypothetical protein VGQ55_14555 [Pyrinomonadaceae bacterium]|nr:hypothetical protein [Pyrinomonadaceae bacterium]
MPKMTWNAELSRYYWKRWKGWLCWHAERPPITRIYPPNGRCLHSMTVDRRAIGARSAVDLFITKA